MTKCPPAPTVELLHWIDESGVYAVVDGKHITRNSAQIRPWDEVPDFRYVEHFIEETGMNVIRSDEIESFLKKRRARTECGSFSTEVMRRCIPVVENQRFRYFLEFDIVNLYMELAVKCKTCGSPYDLRIRVNSGDFCSQKCFSSHSDGRLEGFVYFVKAIGLPLIKIGTAANPQTRLSNLQTGSPVPLYLVCFSPGGTEIERAVHSELGNYRSHGEWFFMSDEVVSVASRLCGKSPQEFRGLAED